MANYGFTGSVEEEVKAVDWGGVLYIFDHKCTMISYAREYTNMVVHNT